MNVDVKKAWHSLAADEVVKLLQSDSSKGLSTKESQLLLTYLPLANRLFHTAPISLIDWWRFWAPALLHPWLSASKNGYGTLF